MFHALYIYFFTIFDWLTTCFNLSFIFTTVYVCILPINTHSFFTNSYSNSCSLIFFPTFALWVRVRMSWFHCWPFTHEVKKDLHSNSFGVSMNGQNMMSHNNLYFRSASTWGCSINFHLLMLYYLAFPKKFWGSMRGMASLLPHSTSIFLYFKFSFRRQIFCTN